MAQAQPQSQSQSQSQSQLEATARVAERARRARSWPESVVDRLWRFFCSVRAAIWEIAALAVLVLIGTLRGSSVPRSLAEAVPAAGPLVDRWYAWDVFHSFLFMALLALIAVAIAIGGILNRAPGIWAAIARPTVATTHGFLRNAETAGRIESALPPAALTERITAGLGTARYRVLAEERGGETHLYADRFRLARLATFPFHVALIMILVGGIVGARWGFRETEFLVPEGTSREVGHGTGLSIRLDDFSEGYLEIGTADEYRSALTVLDGDRPIAQGEITVNNPLTVDNVTVYQSGVGQAVEFRIDDAAGTPLFADSLPLEFQSRLNPDAPAARLDLPPAGLALSIVAPDANAANAPELDTLGLRPGQMFLMARPIGPNSAITTPQTATIGQGETRDFAGLRFTFVREKRFSALQVAHNPGIPIFYAASLMLVGGLAVTFYFPHRRLRGIVAAVPGGGSTATLAPMAKRDWSGQRAFEGALGKIEAALGAPVTRLRRDEAAPPTSSAAEASATDAAADRGGLPASATGQSKRPRRQGQLDAARDIESRVGHRTRGFAKER